MAPGARTRIRARRATSPRTCTRTRSSRTRTGRARTAARPRSSRTSSTARPSTGCAPHLRFGHAVHEARFDEPTGVWTSHEPTGTFDRASTLARQRRTRTCPRCPTSPGSSDFQGATVSFGALGPRRRSRRQAHRGDRHRRERDPVRAADRAARRAAARVPAHAAVDRAEDRSRDVRARALGVRACPGGALAAPHRRCTGGWRAACSGSSYAPKLLALAEKLVSRGLARQCPDPELRAKLTPDYRLGCKRVLISNDYYPALQRPNVELVTEPDRTGDAARRPHRRRHGAPRSTRSSRRPASTSPSICRRSRSSAAAAPPRRRVA